MILRRLFIAFALIASTATAQNELSPAWTAELNGVLNFQTVTATGTYLVSTSEALSAYDMDNGNLIWSNNEITGISEDQLQEVQGSPLLLIRQGAEVKILDPFDGTIKFNSSKAGFSEVKFEQMMYQTNGILVAGTKSDNTPAMVLVDLSNGKIRWEIDEKFGRLVTAQEFSDKELLVVALFNTYRISSEDGSIIWKVASSAEAARMQDAGALGALFQGMAEELAKDFDFVVEYHEQPDRGIFIIAAETANEVTPPGGGEPTTVYENNYTAFNMEDGSRLWEESLTMKGKLGDLAFYKNGVIIMPDDGNNTAINYFTFESPEGQWGKKGRGIKIKGGVYDHIDTGKGILLIAGTYDNTFLSFLDPTTGMLTYDKPVKINGRVMQTFESAKGLGFVTTEKFDILNTATGELILSKSLDTNPGLVEQRNNELFVFDTKKSLLSKVDLSGGTVTDLSAEKLKFSGKEDPQKLELRDNGVLVSSDQNFALFSYTGDLQFNKFYEAPGESGLKKALLVAQAVRAAYIGANAYVAAGTLQAAAPQVAQEDAVGGALVQGFGNMYEDLGNAASDFAKESLRRATARFKATAEARDFVIVLSKIDKDHVLLKVNKNTGDVDAQINLGKEKEPKYAVDDVSGKIFKQADANMIACYDL